MRFLEKAPTGNVYDDGLRRETVTYPDGRVIWSGYGSTGASSNIHDRLGRVQQTRETNSGGTVLADYSYDGLDRLKVADRGNLTGSPYSSVTSKNFAEDWTLDQLGNWPTFKQDNDGNGTWDLNQGRTHNVANELTEIDSSSTHVAEDVAGNMEKIPKPTSWSAHFDLTYDAWNRLVEVEDGMATVQTNEYDGLGHRIVRVDVNANPDVTYDSYYNDRWQLLEERKDGSANPLAQYVWHPYYIDALAVRYWDSNTDNDYLDTNEGTHYYAQDANFNVTAVTDNGGTVVERYQYSPYGEVTFLEDDFDVKGSQTSSIGNTHLYTGRERDPETGLQQYRHRYYHAQLGRFLTRDPIGYRGGMNLYQYTEGRPTIGVDPLGWKTTYVDICVNTENMPSGVTTNCLKTHLEQILANAGITNISIVVRPCQSKPDNLGWQYDAESYYYHNDWGWEGWLPDWGNINAINPLAHVYWGGHDIGMLFFRSKLGYNHYVTFDDTARGKSVCAYTPTRTTKFFTKKVMEERSRLGKKNKSICETYGNILFHEVFYHGAGVSAADAELNPMQDVTDFSSNQGQSSGVLSLTDGDVENICDCFQVDNPNE